MGWLGRVARWVRPQGFGTTRPEDPRRSIQYLPLPVQVAGISLTMEEALQVSVVWACVSVITKAIASSEWHVFEKEADDQRRSVDDPVEWLLNTRPNPEMTAISWREAMLFSALTWGNGYSEIVRSRSGKIQELWPLRADRMWPTREPNSEGQGRLEYWYYNWMGGWTMLESENVLHFRGPSLNGYMGENVVARAAKAIAIAAAQERFVGAFFGNNATLGTVLKYPKTLSDAAYKRMKEDWDEKRAGPDKAHRPFILEGGMELEVLSTKNSETQLVESRTFSLEDICRFYGVPPHKVQHLLRATFNNIEHLGLEFTRDALAPWVRRFCQEVDYKLFPQRAPWRVTNIDTDWLAYGDIKSRWEAYTLARRTGAYSVNDILRMEKRNTIGPEGDVRVIEANMTTLEGLEAQVEKVKAETERAKAPPPPPPAQVPPPPGEGAPPPGEGEAPPGKQGAALREAVALYLEGTLSRYERKLANRERDLRRRASRPEAEVQGGLAELRLEAREDIVGEFREAYQVMRRAGVEVLEEDGDQQARLAADAVDSGVSTVDAAVAVVAHYMKEE